MLDFMIRDVRFFSPIIAASGTFGYGDEVQGFVDLSKIGSVITKSITLEPREGNPSPRIHESNSGMINSIGLANMGVDSFCDTKLDSLNKLKTNFIVSVAGSSLDEYAQVIEQIDKTDGKHVGYEVNISCPNVKEGGIEFGVNKDVTFKLTSRLRKLTDKLLIIKLTPNVANIAEIAQAAESGGADAVSAVNTFQGLAINHKTGKMLLSTKFGGISGPGIKPLALAKVHKIYEQVNIPILGMGGIVNCTDVVEFLRVGASMVQIGTLNYRDPSLISTIHDELHSIMIKNKFSKLSDLIGAYH
jgi:dihydroorotate dehydrogenase (NAD+) catalytic subunit